jgi:hypothetical protein
MYIYYIPLALFVKRPSAPGQTALELRPTPRVNRTISISSYTISIDEMQKIAEQKMRE